MFSDNIFRLYNWHKIGLYWYKSQPGSNLTKKGFYLMPFYAIHIILLVQYPLNHYNLMDGK